jgi:hypothetical protein
MEKFSLWMMYWTPRIASIILAIVPVVLTYSKFGIDQAYNPATSDQLVQHLAPSLCVLIVLAVAWRWEWVGALCFMAFSATYLFLTWGIAHPAVQAIMVIPPLVIGTLFLLSWINRAELHRRAPRPS